MGVIWSSTSVEYRLWQQKTNRPTTDRCRTIANTTLTSKIWAQQRWIQCQNLMLPQGQLCNCCSHVVWRVDQSPLFRIFSFCILPFVFCITQFRILPNTRLIPLFTRKSSFVTTVNPNVKTHTIAARSKRSTTDSKTLYGQLQHVSVWTTNVSPIV